MNNIKRARKGKKIIVKYPQQKGHKKYRINLEKGATSRGHKRNKSILKDVATLRRLEKEVDQF
jgi:hypothetical protein